MIVKLTLEINCGEKTCASEYGKFCKYLMTRMDGTRPSCYLFEQRLFNTKEDSTGWTLRCKECKDAEKNLK